MRKAVFNLIEKTPQKKFFLLFGTGILFLFSLAMMLAMIIHS